MGFRKPFRAAPVKLGAAYRRKQRIEAWGAAFKNLSIGILGGVMLGLGSLTLDDSRRLAALEAVKPVGVWLGVLRAREPQIGDYWRSCNEARAAGTAPIHAGEPGYRDRLDRDDDGIACEPYRGR